VVVGHVFLLIYMRVLDDINRTVTDGIFVDLLHECSKAGLSGANDIRNFEKTRMLTDIICVLRAIWEYFDSGLPGTKNPKEAFKQDDFLALGKFLETSVEDLVLAITLTNDQYEDPVMWGAVEAMNRLFTTGFADDPQDTDSQLMAGYKADDDAKASGEAKKAKKNKNTQEEEKKSGDLGVSWRDGRVFDGDGKETAQSAMRTQIRQQQEQNYVSGEWSDRTPHMTDTQRCNLLAERIRPLMPSKHSLAAVQSFIRNLYHETVEDVNRPSQHVPAIVWPESGSQDGKTRTCLVAKSILSNNKQNRLVSILSKTLARQGMPDIEYITGVPEMRTPFVLLTIIPDHVKQLRAAEPSDFSSFLPPANGKDEKKAAPSRGKHMIRDPGWVDTSVALFVERAITHDMDEDQREAVLRKSMGDLFRRPWIEINCNVEEYGTYRGMSNSLTSFEILRQLGFGDVKRATQLMIRHSRSELYHALPTFDVLLQYPECFHSRDPKYLHKERWRSKRGRDEDEEVPDGKRIRRDASEDSLNALHKTSASTNLGMETSRYRANVDPSYLRTSEFAEYQRKTTAMHRETEMIHANLLRTRSNGSASSEDKHNSMDTEPDTEAKDAGASEAPGTEAEIDAEAEDEETRSGFEPSVMSLIWGRKRNHSDE
jgi:hypothetical protein